MTLQSVWQKCFTFARKELVVEPSQSRLSSDGGLIPFRELDETLQYTKRFAHALQDAIAPGADHTVLEMTRMRVFGILADYEDQNDHDYLRSDPIFKLIANGSCDGPDLASQPTLSRFENRVSIADCNRLRDVFIDAFLNRFTEAPTRLTFDIDPYAAAAHGKQQLVFFHGHYEQHQYQVRLITCAENDLISSFGLLYGSAHAALGVEDDIHYLVTRVRERFPDVEINLRADTAFAAPKVYECCEALRIGYSFGFAMTKELVDRCWELTAEATRSHFFTETPQRLFMHTTYEARSWQHARDVVIKVEVSDEGINRRAVVTNRPGAKLQPAGTYEEYANRGESENRNKELKLGLHGGRLSNHRYVANLFRVAMHALAHNLLVCMRRVVVNPPRDRPENTIVENNPTLPIEALPQPQRRHWFNHRRECDPLGEGQIQTWRTRLIKVAVEVVTSARRTVIRICSSWPFLGHYEAVSDAVIRFAQASPG